MIQLPDAPLPTRAASQLEKWQDEINVLATYPQRVSAAKSQFSARNTKANKTFQAVKTMLTAMCSGARRCSYCEDSAADEVEHFRPKDLYPEAVFAWNNYLYACGNCNSPKSNKFAVFSEQNGAIVDVTRPKKVDPSTITPPLMGRALLIDPRRENPLDFMDLDVLDTFVFIERDDTPEIEQRARYTIETLHLNDRDFLVQARREAFISYRARLREYNHFKHGSALQTQLNATIAAIQRMQHPTVWREMQRKSAVVPELVALFRESPEALTW